MTKEINKFRSCIRDPIPEIFDAARYLDAAVSSHIAGNIKLAKELIRMADMPEIREWGRSITDENSQYIEKVEIKDAPLFFDVPPNAPLSYTQPNERVPDHFRATIIMRDGGYCKYCGIPVVVSWMIKEINKVYPDLINWENENKHAAFSIMELNVDFLIPLKRGGEFVQDNCVISCSSCHYGHGNNMLDEIRILDPRDKASLCSILPWDRLGRFPRS